MEGQIFTVCIFQTKHEHLTAGRYGQCTEQLEDIASSALETEEFKSSGISDYRADMQSNSIAWLGN